MLGCKNTTAVYLQAPALLDEYPVHESPLKLAIHNSSVKAHFTEAGFLLCQGTSPIAFAKFIHIFVTSDYAYDDECCRMRCALWWAGHLFITDQEQGCFFTFKTHTSRVCRYRAHRDGAGSQYAGLLELCEASMQHISFVHCTQHKPILCTLTHTQALEKKIYSYLLHFTNLNSYSSY